MGTSDLTLVIRIPVPHCPKCGKEGLELIGRLIGHDTIPCSFGCGGILNLGTNEYRTFLDKFMEALKEIGPTYNKVP